MSFLQKFYELTIPLPHTRYVAEPDAKSDLKLVLEIATNCRLKQSQDKKCPSRQVFYCRNLGKDCFKIEVEFSRDGYYTILDDYLKLTHAKCQDKCTQNPQVIRIYNLMMLKRDIIQNFMDSNQLSNTSPEFILQKLSGEDGSYFYCKSVSDLESRRKLKKRFDNIVNITIKKKKEKEIKPKKQRKVKVKIQEDIEKYFPESMSEIQQKRESSKKKSQIKLKRKQSRRQTALQIKKQIQDQIKIQNDILLQCEKPRKMVKQQPKVQTKNQSQRSILPSPVPKLIEAEPIFSPQKGDSIFEQSQQNYFKKQSEANIALSMLYNQVHSHNYWPQSEISIGLAGQQKIDDVFVSLKNTVLRNLERKSMNEIQSIAEIMYDSNN